MENKESIFLAKVQLLVNTFEEIDEIIKNTPTEQQNIDYEISDYLHLLQNEDLNDDSMLSISKKLKEARLKREQLQNVSHLIKAYVDNKSSLAYENNRFRMDNAIKNVMNRLHQDYNYRVLDETIISTLKTTNKVKKRERKRNKNSKISKEDLLECVEKGMKTKDIAEYFNTTPSNICHVKKRFGIENRKYNRK